MKRISLLIVFANVAFHDKQVCTPSFLLEI
jgi:hypothetical protein